MKKLALILISLASTVFADDIDTLRTLSKKLNIYTPKFHQSIVTNLNESIPLHGRQLRLMHQIVSHYIDIDKKFIDLIEAQTSKALKILLSLDRIENFIVSYNPFYRTTRFRRYVNDEDISFNIHKNQLNQSISSLININEIQLLNKSIVSLINTDPNSRYLQEIVNHKAMSFIKDLQEVKRLISVLKSYKKKDRIADRVVDLTDRVSGRFGNTAGAIRWRKGHLLRNKKILNEISSNLKPLDIITEKTYFALTDKFIPGHFGHNAIWLGTKEELISLGVWNHKSIIPFQKEIEAGKSILEADRSGTHLKSLEVFMNVDEFAILRLKEINFTSERIEEILTTALSQIGKVYDFNFDVETTDKIVCSELLYQSFTNIHWPTQSYLTKTKLKRTTISPDNITSLALYNESPINLIYYVAQKKKKQIPYYKDLDQLARDMEFVKVNNEYKRVVEVCKQDHTLKNSCETRLEDLTYTPHDHIDGIGI